MSEEKYFHPVTARELQLQMQARELYQYHTKRSLSLRSMYSDYNRRIYGHSVQLQGEEVKKNMVRFLFLGDHAERNAKWLYTNVTISKFFEAVELDRKHEDAVTIRIGKIDPLTQLQALFIMLESINSYRVVGAICPRYAEDSSHPPKGRFLSPMHGPNGDEMLCLGCRRKFPTSFSSEFMDVGELRSVAMLEMIAHIRPMPAPGNKLIPIDTETTGIKGETPYKYQSIGIDYSAEGRNKVTKDVLGIDYATLEIATLFHTLGMRHTIDVKFLADVERTMEAGEWLDQGGGAVLIVDSEDNAIKAKAAIGNWMRRNHNSTRYGLAIVEVDKSKLDTSVMSKQAVRETAIGLAKVRKEIAESTYVGPSAIKEFAEPLIDDRPAKLIPKGRAVGKSTSWAISAEKLYDVTGIDEAEAKRLVDLYYKAWPGLAKWHQMSELTKLTVENEKLREDLKDEKTFSESLTAGRDVLIDELTKANDKLNNKEVVATQPPRNEFVKAADDMLRFLASVNFQDHSRGEQREFLEKFSVLQRELRADALLRSGETKGGC